MGILFSNPGMCFDFGDGLDRIVIGYNEKNAHIDTSYAQICLIYVYIYIHIYHNLQNTEYD